MTFRTPTPAQAVVLEALRIAEETAAPSMTKWQHTTEPLHVRRLGKTGEELAELLAVVSRCLIQGLDEIDPSSGKTNWQRFIDETADVRAQLNCNDRAFGLPLDEIARRVAKKEGWMAEWESHYGAALVQPPEAPADELSMSTYPVGLIKYSEPMTALRHLAKRLREAGIDSSVADDFAEGIEFLLARRDDLRAEASAAVEVSRLATDGMVWAPRAPTQAMVEAGKDERMECFKSTALSVGEALSRIYGAMIAAHKE